MPKRYGEKVQILISRLIDYFQREKVARKTLLPVDAVFNRVSDALGISVSTVQKISLQGIDKDEEVTHKTSQAIALSRGNSLTTVHEHAIRTRIYNMYSSGEHVTIRSLLFQLQTIDKNSISIGRLHKAIKDLKFKWKKCSISNRLFLMEQPYVAQSRLRFLREYIQNEGSLFRYKSVFLDETWLYSKGGFRQSWQDGSLQTVRKKSGEGARFIILHAGTEDGFVPNASLIFKSKSKSGDYHKATNSENFIKWFSEQLLPNLEEPCLVIMDNAPYHSSLVEKIPNASWSKASLITWLIKIHIPVPENAMKDHIWDITKRNVPATNRYVIDELALQYGHKVLRLPPYHCQYNPIELVWSECKRYYDSKIGSVAAAHEQVFTVWNEALEKITPDKWKKYIHHTNTIIGEAWQQDRLVDSSNIMPVIIDLNESDGTDEIACSSDENNEVLKN